VVLIFKRALQRKTLFSYFPNVFQKKFLVIKFIIQSVLKKDCTNLLSFHALAYLDLQVFQSKDGQKKLEFVK